MRTPVHRRLTVAKFLAKWRAEKMVQGFAYARACNALPPLEIVRDGIEWTVVNPNADAKAQPFKLPA